MKILSRTCSPAAVAIAPPAVVSNPAASRLAANFTFATEFGDFDVHGDVAGNRDCERARARAAEIAGFVVRAGS
jgi:hypothetical protein